MISREGGSCALVFLKNSLNRRLIRFLWTAPPLFFPTVTPKRVIPRLLGFIITKKWGKTLFLSAKDLRMKSFRFRTRSSLGKLYDFILHEKRKALRVLNRKPFPSPGPSSADNLPSARGAHSDQKSMSSGTFQIAGLKCSLHNYHIPSNLR